jgi:hypothetical protein
MSVKSSALATLSACVRVFHPSGRLPDGYYLRSFGLELGGRRGGPAPADRLRSRCGSDQRRTRLMPARFHCDFSRMPSAHVSELRRKSWTRVIISRLLRNLSRHHDAGVAMPCENPRLAGRHHERQRGSASWCPSLVERPQAPPKR